METKYKTTVNNDDEYSCGDIGISAQEWYSLITNTGAEQYLNTLLCFLRAKDSTSTCAALAKVNGGSSSHYDSEINGFAKWVQKAMKRPMTIDIDIEDSYWLIPMELGKRTGEGFEWTLRKELAEALRTMLKRNLVSAYKTSLESSGSLSGAHEIYKWEIADSCKGKTPEQIVSRLGQDDCNLIDMQRCKPSLLTFCKNAPEESSKILAALMDDKIPVSRRMKTFYNSVKAIWTPVWGKTVPNDERTAAAILATFNPYSYPYYKWECYHTYCTYMGYEEMPTRECYEHFIELMKELYAEEARDKELVSKIDAETASMFHSDVFCGQDIVWQMQAWMKSEIENQRQAAYWMAGYTLADKDCRDSFYTNGCWMGVGTAAVNKEIESIRAGDVIMLKSTYTKGTDHKTSAIKLCAVGRVLSSPVKDGKYYKAGVKWISHNDEKEFTGFEGSYRQTLHHVTDDLFINYANEKLNMSKYKKYVDLLTANYNLVLTGAPGTGKTFMAQEIAKAMDAETMFVQFHPSYDYTDFVEGLRPVDNGNGQIGFERKDGIFKEFCRKAIQNTADSEKSIESLATEQSWQDKMQQFIDDAVEKGTLYKLSNGNEFRITGIQGHNITVYNEQNEKTRRVQVNADEILELLNRDVPLNIVRDIRNHFNRKFGTQPDSYAFIITREIRNIKSSAASTEVSKVDRKPFVFIIDEINRGEASKIFGELFCAIDPGYREKTGKKGIRVQTQYQNLVPETDVFANGFYIPDNIYILATMNDIDRSVESMDFAMRRRFTWKEVTPNETKDMLDQLGTPLSDKAKAVMARLNASISNAECLGPAYMVGPSYFLKLQEYDGDFETLWSLNLEPLLKEYLRGFRKAGDILEKFRAAYLGKDNDKTEISLEIADEN